MARTTRKPADVRLPRGPEVIHVESVRPDQWRVEVQSEIEKVQAAFVNEAAARIFMEHAQRCGVWIAHRFVSDPSLKMLAPGE